MPPQSFHSFNNERKVNIFIRMRQDLKSRCFFSSSFQQSCTPTPRLPLKLKVSILDSNYYIFFGRNKTLSSFCNGTNNYIFVMISSAQFISNCFMVHGGWFLNKYSLKIMRLDSLTQEFVSFRNRQKQVNVNISENSHLIKLQQ